MQVDSMQFYGDLLNEILGESALSSKHVHLKQSAIDWSKIIVTDHTRVSLEMHGIFLMSPLPRKVDSRNRRR